MNGTLSAPSCHMPGREPFFCYRPFGGHALFNSQTPNTPSESGCKYTTFI